MKNVFSRADDVKARAFVDDYRCATCWGRLVSRFVEEGTQIECAKSDDECDKSGFVTFSYVERARAESNADRAEALSNLPFLNRNVGKSTKDLIDEITGGN